MAWQAALHRPIIDGDGEVAAYKADSPLLACARRQQLEPCMLRRTAAGLQATGCAHPAATTASLSAPPATAAAHRRMPLAAAAAAAAATVHLKAVATPPRAAAAATAPLRLVPMAVAVAVTVPLLEAAMELPKEAATPPRVEVVVATVLRPRVLTGAVAAVALARVPPAAPAGRVTGTASVATTSEWACLYIYLYIVYSICMYVYIYLGACKLRPRKLLRWPSV
jgi:hypothetical protein